MVIWGVGYRICSYRGCVLGNLFLGLRDRVLSLSVVVLGAAH